MNLHPDFWLKKSIQIFNRVTEIVNNKNFEVTVLVYQELPFATDKTITIKKEEPKDNAKNVEIDSASVICWTLRIPPEKAEKTRLQYTIEYPSEESVYFVKQDGRPINY